jgi:hypothetical protein
MFYSDDLNTPIGKVRFYLGDIQGSGVLPNGANFSDEEIQLVLDTGNSVFTAVVALCGLCATRWANAPQSFSADGLSVNHGDRAARWRKSVEDFSIQFGISNGIGTIGLTRADAFSAEERNEHTSRGRPRNSDLEAWEHRHDLPI